MNKILLAFTFFNLTCVNFSIAQEVVEIAVYFDNNQTQLKTKEEQKLIVFVDSIGITEINLIQISAYCDHRGSDTYNNILSTKRAEFVHDILIKKGFDSIIFNSPKCHGEIGSPEVKSENELAKNRKAVVNITYALPVEKENTIDSTEIIDKLDLEKNPIITDDLKVGDKITLDGILFIGGRHALLPESFPSLRKLTLALKQHEDYSIIILGHICCTKPGRDGRDTDTGLINLSTARAEIIHRYLIKNGIEASRLEFKGMKGDLPTGLGDKFDRRVEIEISAID